MSWKKTYSSGRASDISTEFGTSGGENSSSYQSESDVSLDFIPDNPPLSYQMRRTCADVLVDENLSSGQATTRRVLSSLPLTRVRSSNDSDDWLDIDHIPDSPIKRWENMGLDGILDSPMQRWENGDLPSPNLYNLCASNYEVSSSSYLTTASRPSQGNTIELAVLATPPPFPSAPVLQHVHSGVGPWMPTTLQAVPVRELLPPCEHPYMQIHLPPPRGYPIEQEVPHNKDIVERRDRMLLLAEEATMHSRHQQSPSAPVASTSSAMEPADELVREQLEGSGAYVWHEEVKLRFQVKCEPGSCRPCFNHIRRRCTDGDACRFCHGDAHLARRKQKKHQSRLKGLSDTLMPVAPSTSEVADDNQDFEHAQLACPADVASSVLDLENAGTDDATSVAASSVSDQCPIHALGCSPCFLHIRKKCLLGEDCHFCHHEIHGLRHKARKHLRSIQRAAPKETKLEHACATLALNNEKHRRR